jgi:hypothetical protein
MRLLPVLLLSVLFCGCAAKQAAAPPPQPPPAAVGVSQYDGPPVVNAEPKPEPVKPGASATFAFKIPNGWFATDEAAPGIENSTVFLNPAIHGVMIFSVQHTEEAPLAKICPRVADESRNEGNTVEPCVVSIDGKRASFVWTGDDKAGKAALHIVLENPELTFMVIGIWPPDKAKQAIPDFDSFVNHIRLQ